MSTMIETPKISEILWEEFMEPMNISAYKLANDIHVPVSRIQDILHDRRKITVDTSIRLGIYFGLSEKYFLNMQNDIDIRNAKLENREDLETIQALQYALNLKIHITHFCPPDIVRRLALFLFSSQSLENTGVERFFFEKMLGPLENEYPGGCVNVTDKLL